MKPHIVLITNSCPFYGETFLRNELEHIPEDQTVSLFPILLKEPPATSDFFKSNIEVIPAMPSVRNRLWAALRSPVALLRYGEFPAVFKRKQPLRNLLKALKFAYLSESRAQAIHQWLLRHPQDKPLVFYSYWFYETAYTAARLHQMHAGSRFLSRCHGYDLYEVRHSNGYLPFRSYLLKQVDQLHTISEDGKRYLEDRTDHECRQKLCVSRLGTMEHGMNPDADEEVITVVSCSNLVDVKRVDRIINALQLCNCPIRWFHFGDGPLRQTLEAKAETLPSNIQWQFQGSVPNAALMDFYRSTHVDAFVNVSESEGVPVSIMEALSFGIPAIATNVGGTHEIVIDRHNGVLLDPQFDASTLAEAIMQCRDNPEYRQNARAIWVQLCDATANYTKFYHNISQPVP